MKQSDSSPKPNATDNADSNGAEKLERYFAALKNADYSDTFPKVESWLYKTNTQMENQKKERKLKKMKQYFLANKLRLAYPIIFLAILIAACSMPVTQTETVGHMMTWTTPNGDTQAQEQIKNLDWIKGAQLSISENNDNGKLETLYSALLPGSSGNQVDAYKRDLERIKDITSIKVMPLQENVKRPLYSAALNKFFRVNINAEGMSDQDLKKEVERQLREQGVNANIDFTTGPDGKRNIRMQIPDLKNTNDPKDFEVNINDGNNDQTLKVITKKPSDVNKYKGKSDDEIRKMVRDELGNQNLKDNEITITREGDDVKIKVEVEKQDVGPKNK